MMIEIEVQTDNGSAFGYVVDKGEPNIANYLSQHTEHASSIVKLLNSKADRIALLRNMYVEEEFRGQGEGSDLVSQFIDQASDHGAEIIMLISDADEGQAEGFDLVKFYEAFDMFSSFETTSGALMFNSEDIAESVSRMVRKKESEASPTP